MAHIAWQSSCSYTCTPCLQWSCRCCLQSRHSIYNDLTVLHMQALDLNTNRLSADAAASLVAAQMPQLTGLDLDGNQLSSAAVVHLVKGVWPCLCALRLCNNLLDNASMLYLATGNWPCLLSLMLNGNRFSSVGIMLVTAGKWPLLSTLTMDENAVSAASHAILSLDHFEPDWSSGENAINALRLPAPDGHAFLWLVKPYMRNISPSAHKCLEQVLSQLARGGAPIERLMGWIK